MKNDRAENGVRYVDLARIMCPGYEIGDNGTVRNTKTGRPLTPTRKQSGRPCVVLLDWQGKKKSLALARLVLESFRGQRNRAWEPYHIDGDVNNCTLKNLRWKKKRTPQREQTLQMVRGLIRRYKFQADELFPSG